MALKPLELTHLANPTVCRIITKASKHSPQGVYCTNSWGPSTSPLATKGTLPVNYGGWCPLRTLFEIFIVLTLRMLVNKGSIPHLSKPAGEL